MKRVFFKAASGIIAFISIISFSSYGICETASSAPSGGAYDFQIKSVPANPGAEAVPPASVAPQQPAQSIQPAAEKPKGAELSFWSVRGENMFRRIGNDAIHITTSPARIRMKHAPTYLTLAAIGGALRAGDYSIRKWVQGGEHGEKGIKNREKFLKYFKPMGDGVVDFSISGAIYVTGAVIKDEKLKETGLMATEALAFAGGTSALLQKAIKRQRPVRKYGNDRQEVRPWVTVGKKDSFASGHTTMAFALASVVSDQYDNIWVKSASYGTATLVGLERVFDDRHYISDVFVGGMIGTAVGKAIVRFNRNKNTQISLRPIYDPDDDSMKLAMNMKW